MRLSPEKYNDVFHFLTSDDVAVEFNTNAYFCKNQYELVYVANEEDECISRIFEHHLGFINKIAAQYKMHFTYMPALASELQDDEILRYSDPAKTGGCVPNLVGNDFLLQTLKHPDEKDKFKHGIVCLDNGFRWINHEKEEYTFVHSFFPLNSSADKSIAQQLYEILLKAQRRKKKANSSYYGTMGGDFMVSDTAPEDYADDHFNSQINGESTDDLIREIRERVEKLRQRGLAGYVLYELLHPEGKLSKMVITKDYRLILTDYHDMEIKMEPLVKAVYLLFLKHPDGIRFKELPDYRDELTEIYLKLKPNGLTDKVRKSIEDVTNPLLNSINEKCARIRGAFVGQFDNYLAKYYYIDGLRAEPKKISLSRELVVWE